MSEQQQRPRDRVIVVQRESQALPALASFFVPGLGQLIQGRLFTGVFIMGMGIIFGLLCFLLIGIPFYLFLWIGSVIEAAKYDPR